MIEKLYSNNCHIVLEEYNASGHAVFWKIINVKVVTIIMLSMEVPSHHVVIDYFLITAYHQMFYSLLKLHKDSRLWKVMPVSKLTAPTLLKAVRLRLYICPHSRYVMLHSFCIVTHFNWSPLLLVAVTS